ncbi:sodium:solute symporter family transporter [Algisphaera agarilytica]|uniref:Na+/proline symporter n=1 Tax=Algisphaera agarilytica TaxID=1385975 RepID=A0A7X0H3C3_9BACT|nr:Na+:solute symporter [Algisphaera agarilytica]MBB6428302.1 Na+/proline symporter [Algisphaera agarilytica]
MSFPDYLVLLLYVIGLLAITVYFATRVKNTSDMFSAGGQSPWWMSGLSGFMTMFSAGTFVVWGGVAYRYGLVAVSISMCYGVAALLVGWTLAGYWRRLGVSSASEFLDRRFGPSIVQFYIWLNGTFGMFSMGLAVYGLSVIVAALVPISPESSLAFLADADTGHLSVTYLSIALCILVVVITFAGGLWAVLMTDVLQFIVLTVSVMFVVPLILDQVGGFNAFASQAPEGFLKPVAADFTWWFLLGWVAVHYFKVGGEWAFVQRYTCVRTPKDARKSAYIFGVMYLISPIFWMLPPMIYRVIEPIPEGLSAAEINQLSEQAYIRACEFVLPAGMVGLLVAAMASATASMATTQLNVYAGALTAEFYQKLVRPHANQKELVRVGRVMTVVLGVIVLSGAILIPRLGTYVGFILAVTAMLTGPLVLPTIWGLFSKKLSLSAVWIVTIVGGLSAVLARFGLLSGPEFLVGVPGTAWLHDLATINPRVTDLVVGSSVTLVGLCIAELTSSRDYVGWSRVSAITAAYAKQPEDNGQSGRSTLPAEICGYTVVFLSLLMLILAVFTSDTQGRGVLITFGLIMLLLAGLILGICYRLARRSTH